MGGFSVTDTTFKYSGKQYGLAVKLLDLDTLDQDGKAYQFDMSNGGIDSLDIAAGFNDLCLEATLDYTDPSGQVLSFVGRQNVACNIDFVEIHKDFDQSFSAELIDPAKSFKHEFIVKKLEILQREGVDIKFRIHMVGVEWLKLVANVTFSNYNKGTQGIFDILQQCLMMNDLPVNSASFETAASKVAIQYATGGDENIFTIFNYLLERLYYYAGNYEEAMKFIWIDHITGEYNLFDFSKPAAANNPKNLIITTNPSNLEKAGEEEPNQLASMSGYPTTDYYKSLFQRKISQFSYDSNQFQTDMITDNEILQYSNTALLMQQAGTLQFFKTPSSGEVTGRHISRCSSWQNNVNIYVEQAKNLLVGHSIIINTSGNIAWKPTMAVNLMFQKDIREVKTEDQGEYDRWDQSYAGLNGTWIMTKIRHIIQPKDKKYRQNIVLARNFKMPTEAKK